jgi:uncharacterized membrane protein
MRNLLMTVMMLIVVALMFTNIVSSTGGLRQQIETQGTAANGDIAALSSGG